MNSVVRLFDYEYDNVRRHRSFANSMGKSCKKERESLSWCSARANLTGFFHRKTIELSLCRVIPTRQSDRKVLFISHSPLAFISKIMHHSIETPPFGSRGRVGDNRGMKSLLNNKPSPKGQERNLVPVFHMELPKMTEGAKKLRVVWSTYILLPLYHPMQLIFNLNQVMCFPLFACMHLLIYAWYCNLIWPILR